MRRVSSESRCPPRTAPHHPDFCKPEDGTRISVELTVPNQIGHLSLVQVQAEVLRMAIADLRAELDMLDDRPRGGIPNA